MILLELPVCRRVWALKASEGLLGNLAAKQMYQAALRKRRSRGSSPALTVADRGHVNFLTVVCWDGIRGLGSLEIRLLDRRKCAVI